MTPFLLLFYAGYDQSILPYPVNIGWALNLKSMKGRCMKRFYTFVPVLLVLNSLILIANVEGQNASTWMPNAELRAAVRFALNLAADDTLTQADMEDLTSLTARDANINDIVGLEHATNLAELDLRDNNISQINPLSGLTKLKKLKLKGNAIDNIQALSGLTELTLLNLKENDITNVSLLSRLTKLVHLRLDKNNIADVQPLTSLMNLKHLWITGNTLTNAHLLSSLTNLINIDIPIPDPPDTISPDVSISVPSGIQNGQFEATITFTETVSGFVQDDLSLGGTASASTTAWNTTDDTVYTATITPTTSGTVELDVAANVATDAANNQNTAAPTQSITIDIDSPTVTISAPSEVTLRRGSSNFDVTITFSEPVSGYDVDSELELRLPTGILDASVSRKVTNTDSSSIYTATVTIGSLDYCILKDLAYIGNITLLVNSGVATDAGNNPNNAGISRVSVEPLSAITFPMGMNLFTPADVQTGAFEITISFVKDTNDFSQSDIELSGASASITAWNPDETSDRIYRATITPTQNGVITIRVPEDVATPTDCTYSGNIEVSKTVEVDLPLGVEISVPSGVQTGTFDIEVVFTDSVSDFLRTKLVSGGTATASIISLTTTDIITFTATITPTTDGNVTFNVPAGVATDNAGNTNTAATEKTVSVELPAIVEIPDANLASALRSELGLTAGSDITRSELEGLTDFYTHGAPTLSERIRDLSGLEYASNLQSLHISIHRLTDIKVLWNLTNLTTLNLRNNRITNINALWNLTNLTSLDLAINEITAIAVLKDLTNLTTLDLRKNQLRDIRLLGNLTNLTVLNLRGNFITDVNALSGLTGLTRLELRGNPILDTSPLYPLLIKNGGNLSIDIDVSQYPPWDVNEDGSVDETDSGLVTAAIGQSGENIVNLRTDVDSDDDVDADDLLLVTKNIDEPVIEGAAPSRNGKIVSLLDLSALETLDRDVLQAQLDNLRAESDGSLKYLRAIAVLENILTAMRPEKTQLLANYPNPFNPETWIPYHLANSSDVQITIYDALGTAIRSLDLGHQQDGYYTNRSRAAYWNGRNDLGERVASGIYFYQLQANNVSLLRKMLILK